jgi:hypothetical protein
MAVMPNKYNHHFLPRLYLKGFACDDDASHIWEYQRLRDYLPGRNNRDKYNPVRISLAKAGAALGEYAHARPDGTVDFNTYENALEQLEKPADIVFNRIRNLQPISDSDREVFAEYMALMTRRVPARKDLVGAQWPQVVEAEEENIRELFETALSEVDPRDGKRIEVLQNNLRTALEILEGYRHNGMPREIELRTIVESEMPQVRAAMLQMKWQFFVAEDYDRFVTGDNPVHTLKRGVGFSKPYSELTFPVSSGVALVGTYRDVRPGYITAQSELIKEVNRRLIASAKKFAYSSRNRKWVATIMKKAFHRFNLFYAAPELSEPLLV